MTTQNKTKNEEQDLEFLKKHEDKIKEYKEKVKVQINKEPSSYRHLAYQVKNPFKGI